jgi:hypothetical protein
MHESRSAIAECLDSDLSSYPNNRAGGRVLIKMSRKFGFFIAIILFSVVLPGLAVSQDSGSPQEVNFLVFRTLTTSFGTDEQMCNHYQLTVLRDGQLVDLGVGGGTAESTNGLLTLSLTPGDYSYRIDFSYTMPPEVGVTEGYFTVTGGSPTTVEVDTKAVPQSAPASTNPGTGVANIGWAGTNPGQNEPGTAGLQPSTKKISLGAIEIKGVDPESLIQTSEWGEVPSNQVMVKLNEGKGRSDADSLASSLGGRVVGYLEYINLYQIETSGKTETELREAISKAKLDSSVEYVFPNQQSFLDRGLPLDDPVYGNGRGTGYEIVGVQRAWDLISDSGRTLSEVHVGVIDDGLYKGYGEFNGRVKIGTADSNSELDEPLVYYDSDGELRDYTIPGSHGTGVMNIIAADPDNGGLVGIASKPLEDKLMASMINRDASQFDNKHSYAPGGLAAIMRGIENGATIISCSWGNSKADPELAATYKEFFEKISNAYPYLLFICSAGNDGKSLDGTRRYPSGLKLPNMITVGNIMNDGTKATSSNMIGGDFEVTLAAPGQQSVWGRDNQGNIKNDGGGTSMATPHVTAAAAMIRSLNPDLSAGEIKDILKETARTSIDVSGTTIPAPEELGGRILAVDLAVQKTIGSDVPSQLNPLPPTIAPEPGLVVEPRKPGQQLTALNVEIANAVYTDQDRRLFYCIGSNGVISYRNRIYLTGLDLDKVAKVTYIIDPSFPNPEVTSEDPSNSFEIWIMTWGRFPMNAIITTKSGQVFEKTYSFSFKSKVENALAMGIPQVEQC